MAPRTRSKKPPVSGISETDLLKQFILELQQETESAEGDHPQRLTKGQLLIRRLVNGAIKGDPRMLANALKLIEKIQPDETDASAPPARSRTEWETIFAFFGKYKPLIEQEIERLRIINPTYWSFDWYQPELTSAPWFAALHGSHSSSDE